MIFFFISVHFLFHLLPRSLTDTHPQSRQSARLFLQSSELELPPPPPRHPQASVSSLWFREGGHTHLRERGCGGFQFGRRDRYCMWYSRFVYVLCGVWTVDTPFLTLSLCSSPTFIYCTHTQPCLTQ